MGDIQLRKADITVCTKLEPASVFPLELQDIDQNLKISKNKNTVLTLFLLL